MKNQCTNKNCGCLKTDLERKEGQKRTAKELGVKGMKELVNNIPDSVPDTDDDKLKAFASALNWNHTFNATNHALDNNDDESYVSEFKAINARMCAVNVLLSLGMNELAYGLDVYTGGYATEQITSTRISKYSRKMSKGKGDAIPSLKSDIIEILQQDPKLPAKSLIKRLESKGYRVTQDNTLYYHENDGEVAISYVTNLISKHRPK